jgi:hypothetical protein
MRKTAGTVGPTGSARRPYAEPAVLRFGTVRALTQQDGLPNSDVPCGPTSTAWCDRDNPLCNGGVLS